ncbi:MAG: methylenetetrahydrofolate reductase [Eubacteriaceae bacterium]|nr:methylenetetrahydrofolate reductase [Eubacteriaceae bacterium]MBR5995405.1 methylenetetrahydrofolate reductase [Eubacteriaceae bacterium]
MSNLQKALESGKFAITAEMAPPKGVDFSHQMSVVEQLRGKVEACNVTDYQSSSLKASSLGLCIMIKQAGMEPVLQMTGRDRSRMAIQGDFMDAAAFGIENILALTGDHPTVGDCPESKPVYDLDSVGILRAAVQLMEGHDCGGNELVGNPPYYYLGASVTPVYEPVELQLIKMRKKIEAGAKFFQTQGVYEAEPMKPFMEMAEKYGVYLMAGIIPLKTAAMAKYMSNNVPGIRVPQDQIDRLNAAKNNGLPEGFDPKDKDVKKKQSKNQEEEGIIMAAEFLAEIKEKGLAHGAHIMAIGAEENVPVILEKAGF